MIFIAEGQVGRFLRFAICVSGLLLFCPCSFDASGYKSSFLISSQTRATPPTVENAPLAKARQSLDAGKPDDALSIIETYLKQKPNSAEAHFLKGLILFRQTKPSDSLAAFTEGAKYHDPGAFDLKIVALDYVLLDDYASADHWLAQSLERDPKDVQAWYYLGRIKYNENRFEEAVTAFRKCLDIDPRNVKAKDNLGLAYQGLGRTADALDAFQTAIDWQEQSLDKNAGPFLNIGILLLEKNQVDKAMKYLSEAAAIAPNDSRVYEQLGKAYSRQEQFEKAQAELEKAVALSPESSSLHFMLGQVYRKRGMLEKAQAELDRGAALKEAERKKPFSLE
jgi:tetratricopeptide (TPR) repeat protein